MVVFTGCCTAMITPFTEDGIDFPAYGRLIDWQLEQGVDALLVLGTTGEPCTITAQERRAIIDYALQRIDGRVPVVVSTGGNSTRDVIETSREAERAGADALLVVTPYYNKATPSGLIAHFTAVADAVSLPIIIYNVPGRTGCNMTAGVYHKLAQHPNIAGIKEASGNIEQGQEMMRLTADEGTALYSGEDALTVALMAMGAQGVISVTSNVLPRDVQRMCAAALAGDFATAAALQHRMNPLTAALFCEINPIPVKTAAAMLGMCSDRLRLPLCAMTMENKQRLVAEMAAYGLPV